MPDISEIIAQRLAAKRAKDKKQDPDEDGDTHVTPQSLMNQPESEQEAAKRRMRQRFQDQMDKGGGNKENWYQKLFGND